MSATSLVEAAVLGRDGRRRGGEIRFTCPAHPDKHPSADFNPARAVWICRACGAGGGLRDLARRLGINPGPRAFARPRRLSVEEELVRREARVQARLARFRPLFRLADEVKESRDAATGLLRRAATLPEDGDDVWNLVFAASELQREADQLEAEADDLMRAMR